MKQLFLAAHLAFFCLNHSTIAKLAHVQTAVDKPSKVTFHGVYKLPDYEIYTIIKGIRTPIKESAEILIEPNSVIVLRAVNLKTNQIVAREKIMYTNLATDLIFESIEGEKILYKRKATKSDVKPSTSIPTSAKSIVAGAAASKQATVATPTENNRPMVKPKPGTFPEKDGVRSSKGIYDEKAPSAVKTVSTQTTNATVGTNKTTNDEKLDPRATLSNVNMPKEKVEVTPKVGNLGAITAKPIIIKKAPPVKTPPAPVTKKKAKQ